MVKFDYSLYEEKWDLGAQPTAEEKSEAVVTSVPPSAQSSPINSPLRILMSEAMPDSSNHSRFGKNAVSVSSAHSIRDGGAFSATLEKKRKFRHHWEVVHDGWNDSLRTVGAGATVISDVVSEILSTERICVTIFVVVLAGHPLFTFRG